MAIRLAELAVRYGCELHGDPDQEISTVGTLESAGPESPAYIAKRAKYEESGSKFSIIPGAARA